MHLTYEHEDYMFACVCSLVVLCCLNVFDSVNMFGCFVVNQCIHCHFNYHKMLLFSPILNSLFNLMLLTIWIRCDEKLILKFSQYLTCNFDI